MDTPAFGCASCFRGEPAAAWAHREGWRPIARLIDESHFSVTLLACPACGQTFVSIFTETIDWADGDDPQEWLLLPVTGPEAEALRADGDRLRVSVLQELGIQRRFLEASFPKGGARQIAWRDGGLLIPPHD